jgi:plasmid stabilization system protein ParE
MTVLILPSARDDLSEGFDFYERQEEGLGDYFQESLFSDIESLRIYAGIHARRFGCFRMLSKRFPYAVYYDLERQAVRVWAILDCRRDPNEIRKKLTGLRRS